MDILRDYVWVVDKNELRDLIESGYEIIFQDVNLSEIYSYIAELYSEDELQEEIHRHLLGYYGHCRLLQVNGMYYWIMQV